MALSFAVFTPQDNLEKWNSYVSSHPRGTFMQLSQWADVKKSYGWDYEVLVAHENDAIVGGALLLQRSGLMGLAVNYVAYGPLWEVGREEVLARVLDELEQRSKNLVALRLELNVAGGNVQQENEAGVAINTLQKRGYIGSPKMLQPEATLMLDTSVSESELMAAMRQTTRRYIRKAERAGVEVTIDTKGEALDEFYSMLHEVDGRKRFGIHEQAYYAKVWKIFTEVEGQKLVQPYILTVSHDGVTVGSYFLVRMGNKSWELYGGVTELGMQMKANYLLKWKSILLMKQEGVELYDQWGVAPRSKVGAGESTIDSGHPLAGVTYFKEGFGGQRKEYIGSWDKPFNTPAYWLARFLKKI